MNIGQKILAVIGILGLILLTPVIFYTFGNSTPIDFLGTYLGNLGSPSVLTFVSFCMIGTMTLLGGGKNLSATLLSLFIGGLLISTAVEIGFLAWFQELTSKVDFLSNLKLNLLAGLFVLLFGMFLSYTEKMSFKVELLALIVLPVGFLVGSSYAGILPNNDTFTISMNDGMESLKSMIDTKYMAQENVQKYVEEVETDENLTEEEKIAKMEVLQDKITKMESEEELMKKLKEENEQYKKMIQAQEEQLKEYQWCAGSRDSGSQVRTIPDAVVSNQPCVRDFAVSLVKEKQGSYSNRERGIPSKEGIKQLCSLHKYLSSNWKYISDPTMIRNDYFSPANRTIALGLAGDCDDFSILNVSCVEAIGGKARIMIGYCSGGGHAWGEVLIGSKSDWDYAVKLIRKEYKDSYKQLTPNIDADGFYWLPLDWRMGQFTCNSIPHKMITVYTSAEQLNKPLQ
ncbi:MAG: transglutaminase domain-containing protein [Aureispira sp.]